MNETDLRIYKIWMQAHSVPKSMVWTTALWNENDIEIYNKKLRLFSAASSFPMLVLILFCRVVVWATVNARLLKGFSRYFKVCFTLGDDWATRSAIFTKIISKIESWSYHMFFLFSERTPIALNTCWWHGNDAPQEVKCWRRWSGPVLNKSKWTACRTEVFVSSQPQMMWRTVRVGD